MDQKLRNQVLKKIKPTEKEHEKYTAVVNEILFILNESSKKLKIKCNYFVGGSFGKNTYLKGKFDVDIFARFDLSYQDNTISSLLEKILLNTKIKFKKQKGSRDYFNFIFGPKGKEIYFEIIPNRNINNPKFAINSTDVSPYHVEFIKKCSEKNPELTNEIRLAKQYFKSKEIYGAESYINGFSGHVIDILICYFTSLEKLILSAKNWNEQTFIDISNFFLSKEDAFKIICDDKLSNLILVDPILKERNAARALLEEKYFKFIMLAQEFEKFSLKDFEVIKKKDAQFIKNSKKFAKDSNLKIIIYKFKIEITTESEDIVGSKLLKLQGRIKNYFEFFDFKVFKDDFFIDMENEICLFIYYLEKQELAKIKIAIGPKVYMKEDIKRFLNGKKQYFILDSRICIYKKREIIKIEQIEKIPLTEMKKLLGKEMNFVKKVEYL